MGQLQKQQLYLISPRRLIKLILSHLSLVQEYPCSQFSILQQTGGERSAFKCDSDTVSSDRNATTGRFYQTSRPRQSGHGFSKVSMKRKPLRTKPSSFFSLYLLVASRGFLIDYTHTGRMGSMTPLMKQHRGSLFRGAGGGGGGTPGIAWRKFASAILNGQLICKNLRSIYPR